MAELPAVWIDQATGLSCVILRGPIGALNGYVAVPEDHPWFEKGYSTALCGHEGCYEHTPEAIIDVHGGITFASHLRDHEGWYFGFDTAHAGDLVPGLPGHDGDVERGCEYVKAEVERLAKQLAEVG